MKRFILATALALAGLFTVADTASAQVVYYGSGYTPYYYGGYNPAYGGTVYSTPGVTSYYYPSGGVVAPYSNYVVPAAGVVTSSYYTPYGYSSGYSYPYTYNYRYAPYYGGYTYGRRWR